MSLHVMTATTPTLKQTTLTSASNTDGNKDGRRVAEEGTGGARHLQIGKLRRSLQSRHENSLTLRRKSKAGAINQRGFGLKKLTPIGYI